MALKYRVYSTDDSSSSIVTGLTLDRLLQKIGAPVDEEQAWALCHQCFISLSVCCSNFPIVPISAKNTVLTVEGDIRFLAGKEEDKSRPRSFPQVLNDVGILMFTLLDYGIQEDQERSISSSLEQLIELLVTSELSSPSSVLDEEEFADDSDTESRRDSASPSFLGRATTIFETCVFLDHSSDISSVLKICQCHVNGIVTDPALHYQKVCKSLMKYVIGLITMDRKFENFEIEQEKDIRKKSWPKLLQEVTDGVKLRHVSVLSRKQSVKISEFELLLMSISKFNKQSLKPIMKYGSPSKRPAIPKKFSKSLELANNNIHDSLMKQILSKPKLKPVSERRGRSLSVSDTFPRSLSPRELLMNDIQKSQTLRKVQRPSMANISYKSDFTKSLSSIPDSLVSNNKENVICRSQIAYSNNALEDFESPLPPLLESVTTSEGLFLIETKPGLNKKGSASTPVLESDHLEDCDSIIDNTGLESSPVLQIHQNFTGNGDPMNSSVINIQPVEPVEIDANCKNQRNSTNTPFKHERKSSFVRGMSSSMMNLPSNNSHYDLPTFTSLFSNVRPSHSKARYRQSYNCSSTNALSSLNDKQMSGNTFEQPAEVRWSHEFLFDESDDPFTDDSVEEEQPLNMISSDCTMSVPQIITIQTTLAKAHLNNIQLSDSKLFRELQTGKVCFTCQKKRFGLLNRPKTCFICHQLICVKCTSKKETVVKIAGHFQDFQFTKNLCICISCSNFMKENATTIDH